MTDDLDVYQQFECFVICLFMIICLFTLLFVCLLVYLFICLLVYIVYIVLFTLYLVVKVCNLACDVTAM